MKRTRITQQTFSERGVISVGGYKVSDLDVLCGYIGCGGAALNLPADQIQAKIDAAKGMPSSVRVSEILKLQDKFPTICNLDVLKAWLAEKKAPKWTGETPPPAEDEQEEDGTGTYGESEKTSEGKSERQGQGQGNGKKGSVEAQMEAHGADIQGMAEGQREGAGEQAQKMKDIIAELMIRDKLGLHAAKQYADSQVSELEKKIPKMGRQPGEKAPAATFEIVIKRPDEEPQKADGQVFHPNFPLILACANARVPVYMVGPAGTGKTTIGRQVADSLKLNYYPMSFNSRMSNSSLFGFVPMSGEGYQGTPFRSAYEHGGVNLWDEIDNGDANLTTGANMATSNHQCAFPDKIVDKHENFVLLAGANTFGRGANRNYVGRNALDAATLDRFAFVEVDYDNGFEESMLTGEQKVGLVEVYKPKPEGQPEEVIDAMKWVERVRKIRETVEKLDIRIVLSPRVILYGTKMLRMGVKDHHVENMLVWWKMDSQTRSRVKNAMGHVDPIEVPA